MARVEISFFTTGNRSAEGGTMPVPRMAGLETEVLTTTGSSVSTSAASTAPAGAGFARVGTDGDVWVVAGASPVAIVPAPGEKRPGLRVRAGQPVDLAVAQGDKIAAITA